MRPANPNPITPARMSLIMRPLSQKLCLTRNLSPINFPSIAIQVHLAAQVMPQVSGVRHITQETELPRQSSVATVLLDIKASLDDVMEARGFRKMLLPRLPRARAHLGRSMLMLLQNFGNAMSILLRNGNRKLFPRHAVIGLPGVREDHACPPRLHRLVEPNASRAYPSRAQTELRIRN